MSENSNHEEKWWAKGLMFENIFNQIDASSQVIATGSSKHESDEIRFSIDGTHGLYSRFSWERL